LIPGGSVGRYPNSVSILRQSRPSCIMINAARIRVKPLNKICRLVKKDSEFLPEYAL
jgi:hypothetical protein